MKHKKNNVQPIKTADTTVKDNNVRLKEKKNFNFKTLLKQALGIVLLLFFPIIYMQALPVLLVYIGAYIGVSPLIEYHQIDYIIWIVTSSSVGLAATVGLCVFMRMIWVKLIRSHVNKK